MKERPILMSGEMVLAILSGAKTQTRRAAKIRLENYSTAVTPREGGNFLVEHWPEGKREFNNFGRCETIRCPYGVPGDRLWVRETWRVHESFDPMSPSKVGVAMNGDVRGCIDYLATPVPREKDGVWGKTRVSIHMPRWASRIALEIVDVRIERLLAISETDAIAEGIRTLPAPRWRPAGWKNTFWQLWDDINGRDASKADPLVWAVEFRRL